jgi:agmatinase
MRPLSDMKAYALLSLLFCNTVHACGGKDDGKTWTREELAELEAKWGHEVSFYAQPRGHGTR